MSREPDGYLPPDRREANVGTPYAKRFYQQCLVCGRWTVWGDPCRHDRDVSLAHATHTKEDA